MPLLWHDVGLRMPRERPANIQTWFSGFLPASDAACAPNRGSLLFGPPSDPDVQCCSNGVKTLNDCPDCSVWTSLCIDHLWVPLASVPSCVLLRAEVVNGRKRQKERRNAGGTGPGRPSTFPLWLSGPSKGRFSCRLPPLGGLPELVPLASGTPSTSTRWRRRTHVPSDRPGSYCRRR
jgi:hypothetical protein